MPGVPVQNIWTDIPVINNVQARRSPGYPTQKPEALLERIIRASTTKATRARSVLWVRNRYCRRTEVEASLDRNRHHAPWLSTSSRTRLRDHFGEEVSKAYDIIGEPVSVKDAAELAKQDPFQFQSWALGLVGARVATSAKKGADRGIDGRLYFHDDKSGKSKQIILSVKAGENINVAHVRDLRGVH